MWRRGFGCANDCATTLADTWVLLEANGLGGAPAWTQLPDAPIARENAVANYPAAENRLIVFGGAERNDVWVLKDANGIGTPAWEELTPGGDLPAPRSGSAGAYDATGNRLVVFGGLSIIKTRPLVKSRTYESFSYRPESGCPA